METSFCELKGKEVINITDGKKLGRIIDLVFDACYGRVLGIVVPSYNKSWNIFKASDDIFIPYKNICKFGDDAILVQIYIEAPQKLSKKGKFVRCASAPNEAQGGLPANAQNFGSNTTSTNLQQNIQNNSGDTGQGQNLPPSIDGNFNNCNPNR